MRRKHLTLLLALSVLLTQARPALAQAPAASDAGAAVKNEPTKQQGEAARRIDKLKRVVNKVGVGRKITVFLENGDELHGTVSRIGADDFDVAEVDLQRAFTVRYEFVKKVREGYGNFNLFTGSRRSPRRGTQVAAIAVGLFFAVGLPLILVAGMED